MEQQCLRALEPTRSLCVSGSGTPVMYLAGSYFALILRSEISHSHTRVAADSYLLGYYAISTRSTRLVARLHDPKNEGIKIFRRIGNFYQLTRVKSTENLNLSMISYLTAYCSAELLS